MKNKEHIDLWSAGSHRDEATGEWVGTRLEPRTVYDSLNQVQENTRVHVKKDNEVIFKYEPYTPYEEVEQDLEVLKTLLTTGIYVEDNVLVIDCVEQ